MSDLDNLERASEKGDRARRLLESAEYQESWDIYRQRIFDQFEAAKSDDVDMIMQLKRLLTAAAAARAHMEALVVDGRVALENIKLYERPTLRERIRSAIR